MCQELLWVAVISLGSFLLCFSLLFRTSENADSQATASLGKDFPRLGSLERETENLHFNELLGESGVKTCWKAID